MTLIQPAPVSFETGRAILTASWSFIDSTMVYKPSHPCVKTTSMFGDERKKAAFINAMSAYGLAPVVFNHPAIGEEIIRGCTR